MYCFDLLFKDKNYQLSMVLNRNNCVGERFVLKKYINIVNYDNQRVGDMHVKYENFFLIIV